MCLYPKTMLNKHYLPTRKNGYQPPPCDDERKRFISIPCGNCLQCRKQMANEWRIRLGEELKLHPFAYFVTLTFEDTSLDRLCALVGTSECNAVASYAVRHFLERKRKYYAVRVKEDNGKSKYVDSNPWVHWLITELGQTNTERIHLHGIIFASSDVPLDTLSNLWKYGRVDNGKYCNSRSINYIVKYLAKIDSTHIGYKPQIFASKGIGKSYISKSTLRYHRFNGESTIKYYSTDSGYKLALPRYLVNKLYSEAERSALWSLMLDADIAYIDGIKVDNASSPETQLYQQTLLSNARKSSTLAGFGSSFDHKMDYNVTANLLKRLDKIASNSSTKRVNVFRRKKTKRALRLSRICVLGTQSGFQEVPF